MASPSAPCSLTSEAQGGPGNQSQGQDVTSDPAHSGQLHQPASPCGRLCPSPGNKGEGLTPASPPPPHAPAGWTPAPLQHPSWQCLCGTDPTPQHIDQIPETRDSVVGMRLLLVPSCTGMEDQDGDGRQRRNQPYTRLQGQEMRSRQRYNTEAFAILFETAFIQQKQICKSHL